MGYYEEKKSEIDDLLALISNGKNELKLKKRNLDSDERVYQRLKREVMGMAKQRQRGFPILAQAYDELFQIREKEDLDWLRHKKRPAFRAADKLKEYSKEKREALAEKKIFEYIVKYYESICPFLIDLKKEELGDVKEEEKELLKEYTKEELKDETTKYLTKEEYRKLSTVKRNQMALDRYWKRPKSKWHIGKIYERYVGYLFEEKGYDVEYVGIFKGFEDLGRDLIATKGNEIIVIQCKNWSKFKTIYENHIFQFFGTVFKYSDENRRKKVRGIFYATTNLSDLARRFGEELGIELEEKFKMDNDYPCIKCNVSRVDGTKIYHLPFDQQYDNVKIEKERGEFYCKTTKKAEEKGFRRAFRYKGLTKGKSG